MEDLRAVYERLVKAGSPRITLRDHASEVRGEKRKVSSAWTDFQHVGVDGKDEGYVTCKKCRIVLRYNPINGTSTMSRHSKVHSASAHSSAAVASGGQMTITNMANIRGSNVPEGQKLKAKADLATAVSKCCYMDIRPYHMIEGDGFKHLAQALINVRAKHGSVRAEDVLPSEATVARYTKEAAEDLRNELKLKLKEVRRF